MIYAYINVVLMGLTETCSWRNLIYSMASESTDAVSVWHTDTHNISNRF